MSMPPSVPGRSKPQVVPPSPWMMTLPSAKSQVSSVAQAAGVSAQVPWTSL